MSSDVKCYNSWDIESKHIMDVSGVSEAIYAGECRWGGGEKYVLYEREEIRRPFAFDVYNMAVTGDVTKTLNAVRSDSDHTPVVCYDNSVICFKERAGKPGGGKGILIEQDKTFTLSTQLDQMVCYMPDAKVISLEGNGYRPSHMGAGFSEDGVMYTLNTIEKHSVCYAIDSHPEDSRFRVDGSGIMPTITAKMKKGSADGPLILFRCEERR